MELKYKKLLINETYAQAVNTATINTNDLKGAGFAAQLVVANNAPSAKAFGSGAYEVNTLTFETKANTDSGDYVVITAVDGTTYALALDKAQVAELATITFPDYATFVENDYIVVTAQDGLSYAISGVKLGGAVEPSGAIWTAIAGARKALVDLTGQVTAADVAAAFEVAFDALTGFTAKVVTDDTAADGTMTFTQQVKGAVADPVPKNANDSGAGTISVVITTAGVDPVTPTGAAYLAVNAARRALVDITSATTAAQVAALAETGIDAITGFTAKIVTDDSAANGTMTFTQVIPGVVANIVPHSFDDGTAGGIAVAETTPGTATDVNITSNAITETAHGFKNGLKAALSTAGVLPAGLSATDYYLIYVDANSYKFATSQANALAGTAVDITDYGTGTHTVTPNVTLAATITLKQSIDGTNFDQIDSLTEAISAAGNYFLQKDVIHAPFVRVDMAVTSGQLELDLWVSSRGD